MNYTLHQLQIFRKIVETRSITKASEALHLTQPAVSIQLRKFQDQFDIPLAEVIGRQLFITDFGREIDAAAESILRQVDAINFKMLAHKGILAGRLKVSVVSTGKYVMPYFLSGFIDQHPGIDLEMDVTNKTKVIESLERNEIDLALVSILPATLRVEKLDLLQNKLFLVGNANSRFKRKRNTRELLSTLPLIFREKGSGTRQVMESFIDRNKIQVKKKIELTSNEAVKQAVLAGLGYSIMPLIGIRNELHNQELQLIPVKGLPITTTWRLIWLKGKNHSPVTESFLQYLHSNKNEIIKKVFHWYEHYA